VDTFLQLGWTTMRFVLAPQLANAGRELLLLGGNAATVTSAAFAVVRTSFHFFQQP
jgi:hypothetical protein